MSELHSKKFHQLVLQAKQLGRKTDYNRRCEYVRLCLQSSVTHEIQALIDVHLKRIASLHTNLGKDSTEAERRLVKTLQQHEMYKIKEIDLEYYKSIEPNDE